jgi:antitoxin component of RelBE/YafQ-DinJ toxin-antitoxin module
MLDNARVFTDGRALATINVRMPQSLKVGGETVLDREGLSVSEAIRRFYLFLDRRQELPDCIKNPEWKATGNIIEEKREVLRGLVGIASPILSVEDIRDQRLEKHLRSGLQ